MENLNKDVKDVIGCLEARIIKELVLPKVVKGSKKATTEIQEGFKVEVILDDC